MAKLPEVQHIFDGIGRPYPKQSLTKEQTLLFPHLNFSQPHPGGLYRCDSPYSYGKPITSQPRHVRDIGVVSTETLETVREYKALVEKLESEGPKKDADEADVETLDDRQTGHQAGTLKWTTRMRAGLDFIMSNAEGLTKEDIANVFNAVCEKQLAAQGVAGEVKWNKLNTQYYDKKNSTGAKKANWIDAIEYGKREEGKALLERVKEEINKRK